MYSSYLFYTLLYIVTPIITKKSKSKVTVVVGNVVYLVCTAEGFPSPSVTWTKDDKVLQTNINKTDFIIDEASERDAGKYDCEASNSVETVSYTVEVAIKGKVTRSIQNCFLTHFTPWYRTKLFERNKQKDSYCVSWSHRTVAEFLRTVTS